MKLENLTPAEIRKFAGATIYERGKDYFSTGMVLVCDYDEAKKSLRAEVSGNYAIMKSRLQKKRVSSPPLAIARMTAILANTSLRCC